MTPDRLRGWLKQKVPTAAVRLQLAHERLTGLEQVCDWTREDVETQLASDNVVLVEEILAQAQELADAEGSMQSFRLRWLTAEDVPKKATTHRAKPGPGAEAPQSPDDSRDARFLAHFEARERNLNQVLTTISTMYDRTLQMMSEQLAQAHRMAAEARQNAVEASSDRKMTDEEREEVLMRTEALRKLTDKLPDAVDIGLEALASYVLKSVGDKTKKPNLKDVSKKGDGA